MLLNHNWDESAKEVAKHALEIRNWLRTIAGPTLQVTTARTYLRGEGKDWAVKGDIAYGAGAVHGEFKALQADLNVLAQHVGFSKLTVDGFLGPKTATAVKKPTTPQSKRVQSLASRCSRFLIPKKKSPSSA